MSWQSIKTRFSVLAIAFLAVLFAIGIVQAEGGPSDPRITHPPVDALEVGPDGLHDEGSEPIPGGTADMQLDLEPISGPEGQ